MLSYNSKQLFYTIQSHKFVAIDSLAQILPNGVSTVPVNGLRLYLVEQTIFIVCIRDVP